METAGNSTTFTMTHKVLLPTLSISQVMPPPRCSFRAEVASAAASISVLKHHRDAGGLLLETKQPKPV